MLNGEIEPGRTRTDLQIKFRWRIDGSGVLGRLFRINRLMEKRADLEAELAHAASQFPRIA